MLVGEVKNRVDDTLSYVSIPNKKLSEHVAVFGSSGSGKTGMVIKMVEEALNDGIDVLVVDRKGDLAALAATYENLDYTIITPGSDIGQSVNLLSNLTEYEGRLSAATRMLKMCGHTNLNPSTNGTLVYLAKVLEGLSQRASIDVPTLIAAIHEPAFEAVGTLDLDTFMPAPRRAKLAAQVNLLSENPTFRHWITGNALDMNKIFGSGQGRLTIFSVAHIYDIEALSGAVALVCEAVQAWVKKQPGSDTLCNMLVIDELADLAPAYPKNPPSKAPIAFLLKQARAFGLGLVLASQNPRDLCSRLMANCATWVLGRLPMKADQDRVVEVICANVRGMTPSNTRKLLANLDFRQFFVSSAKLNVMVRSIDTDTDITGPLSEQSLRSLHRREV